MRETVSEEVKAIERGRREKSVRARGFEERKREREQKRQRKNGRTEKERRGGRQGESDRMDKTRRNGKSMRRGRGEERERASDDEVEQEWDSARGKMKEGKGCKKARGG